MRFLQRLRTLYYLCMSHGCVADEFPIFLFFAACLVRLRLGLDLLQRVTVFLGQYF